MSIPRSSNVDVLELGLESDVEPEVVVFWEGERGREGGEEDVAARQRSRNSRTRRDSVMMCLARL